MFCIFHRIPMDFFLMETMRIPVLIQMEPLSSGDHPPKIAGEPAAG